MKDNSIKKVIILGSGALKIGQAGEFDYSGAQALKAMREDGIYTILINPNIATVQTSEGVADKVYFLPVTPKFVKKVIEKEKPDSILLSFGGQTALNCGVELYQQGFFESHNVKVLGTPVQVIMDTEDRELFVERLDEVDIKTIRSTATNSIEEARAAAKEIGYPVILRSAYALGGLGSGFCDNEEELNILAEKAFSFSPQVLVEKSLRGWKEIEFEVVRDAKGVCLPVCNMENFDPLGIHTGESIVVAPCQSLTPEELKYLEELAVKMVNHLGIVGECNMQFAFAPDGSMDYRVIEVNARLSRSSALASKATGYPLASIAAKIGLGYDLCEITDYTSGRTLENFRPALDYIICKIPRWDLAKFKGVSREIGTSMKSVGEVMSIGRTFEEAMQKGLRMVGQGAYGFVCHKPFKVSEIDNALAHPTDNRVFALAAALQNGYSIDKIYELTKIDKWFLLKLQEIEQTYQEFEAIANAGKAVADIPAELLAKAKKQGFSDLQIARVFGVKMEEVRNARLTAGLKPAVRKIPALALRKGAEINYLYLTYGWEPEKSPYPEQNKTVIVLGSGAYRIGSSVEFDWCSVSALHTLRDQGYTAVMVNYNPETVSTDYDDSDRLYFDELTEEVVRDICDIEHPYGVIVSVGGQIPNNLALPLQKAGINILGTSATDIDRAEDRNKFSSIVDKLGIDQPRWSELTTFEDIEKFISEVGFPVLVRPSYVLSGAAMNVCHSKDDLHRFLDMAVEISEDHPVVISSFMTRCKEVEVDAVADNGKMIACAISEHIEFAGVHSGDATIEFPAQRLYATTVAQIKHIASAIANELHITGPFNIQFLAGSDANGVCYQKVIECNLRASRSFPFVSKVLKGNLIDLATKAMLGLKPAALEIDPFALKYVGIKCSQFSFSRLNQADPVLGVDMASTGEVGCIGSDVNEALLKSMLSVGHRIPGKGAGILISSGDAYQKAHILDACRMLVQKGYTIYATHGTCAYLRENGVAASPALWPNDEGTALRAIDLIQNHDVDLVVNVPKNYTTGELTNGYKLRRAAIDHNVPLITNSRLATAFIKAFCSICEDELPVRSWDEY
ncbi:MAG: carbamoyl-phosphate synthase (glutamine-hydrolyzing) large subunit [Bacteroidales bacterium]|nr:carbamoyl-phosphate synthase (glutamine-hydrolyzing) large subunit [Bacteroidales bacterium]